MDCRILDPGSGQGVIKCKITEADIGGIEEIVLRNADIARSDLSPVILGGHLDVIGDIRVSLLADPIVDKVATLTILSKGQCRATVDLEEVIGEGEDLASKSAIDLEAKR